MDIFTMWRMHAAYILFFYVGYVTAAQGRQLSIWNLLSKITQPQTESNDIYDYSDQEVTNSQLSSRAGISKDNVHAYQPDYERTNEYADGSGYSNYDTAGHGDGKVGHFMSALAAFLPVGFFLAATIPNIITVSATGRKRRNADTSEATGSPLLNLIYESGLESIVDPECQKKYFCDVFSTSSKPEANDLYKSLWYFANLFPEAVSDYLGIDSLQTLLKNAQNGMCSLYNCKKKQWKKSKPNNS
ncbi:uncharacterized protein LOC136029026 isoform X4 [Artemia franciscana]|uniref:uncharacterized protein LOC136029026 isoform X4 n=1 Tax=Artemia franciscana TaxID=6661 RepID=UPI0032DAEBC3